MDVLFKNNWVENDYFNLDSDYIRIKQGVSTIKALALRLYKDFDLVPLAEYSMENLPFAEFINNIESSVDNLANNIFRNPMFLQSKQWKENQPIWNYEDLNRIEGNLKLLNYNLTAQTDSRVPIALTLGGGRFGRI
ncbi:MAG: hypothetical protein WAX04_06620 [Oscillospiraceae bacterium]